MGLAGAEWQEVMAKGCGASFWGSENVLNYIGNDDTIVNIQKALELYTYEEPIMTCGFYLNKDVSYRSRMNKYFLPCYFLSYVTVCLTHITSSSSPPALFLVLTGSRPAAIPEGHSAGLARVLNVLFCL